MSDYIVIQGPATRAESVRAKLAELAWEEGLSAFVSNSVPFSFSSGRVLANGIAEVLSELAQGSDDLKVMELGAGIGYLSAFCLDALERDDPDGYAKATFVVTDSAESLIRDAQTCGVLNRHGDHAEFRVSDLRDHESIQSHTPRVLLLSYLIDAIPPRHLERKVDGVHSARIETQIPSDLEVYDCDAWPPDVLDAKEIAERLANPGERLTPALARKLVTDLSESWSWSLDDEDTVTDGVVLNGRQREIQSLLDLMVGMPEDCAIVVTDFGYVSSEEIELNEIMTEYGLCAFWAVAFDEIASLAKSRGISVALHAGEEGETHTILLYRGERWGAVETAFRAGFEDMVSDRPRFVLYNLEEDATIDDIREAVEKIEGTMPIEDIESYGNLARFAHLFLQFGDVEAATRYAERCVELFPEVAAPEMSILGSAAGRNGDLAAAEVLFRRAVEVAPGHPASHLGLSGVYRARQDWPRYFEAIRNYMRVEDCDVQEVMSGIAATLDGTELQSEADIARDWVAAQTERKEASGP